MENNKQYDIKDIMEILPHRPPFLLIDKIVYCDEYKDDAKVIAEKNVTINEDFFRGHFPDEPVMPGVLIVEALAQTGAFLILSEEYNRGKIAYFAGADKVKFKQVVRPGDTLRLKMELLRGRPNAGKGKGTAYVNDKIVATGEFTFFIK